MTYPFRLPVRFKDFLRKTNFSKFEYFEEASKRLFSIQKDLNFFETDPVFLQMTNKIKHKHNLRHKNRHRKFKSNKKASAASTTSNPEELGLKPVIFSEDYAEMYFKMFDDNNNENWEFPEFMNFIQYTYTYMMIDKDGFQNVNFSNFNGLGKDILSF